jgi:hypothetical protein
VREKTKHRGVSISLEKRENERKKRNKTIFTWEKNWQKRSNNIA